MKQVRELSIQKNKSLKNRFFKWETLLALILLVVCFGLKVMAPEIVSFGD